MLNKALVLLMLMTGFFFIKELSNIKAFDTKTICMAEDLNENTEDDSYSNSEEDLNWSTCNQTTFNIYIASLSLKLFSKEEINQHAHPYFEIQSPPPQRL